MLARIRKGDKVIVISGDDKGKTGTVTRVMAEEGKVVVSGINLVKRHTRPNAKVQQGGIIEREAPIFASKVMPIDPKTGKGTRVRTAKDEKGQKTRVAKSGEHIPAPARA
ncbi:MAG: 50S ribosomal protein L24 [Polyangiaceae bacterium]